MFSNGAYAGPSFTDNWPSLGQMITRCNPYQFRQ
jgi:hypothetical protein